MGVTGTGVAATRPGPPAPEGPQEWRWWVRPPPDGQRRTTEAAATGTTGAAAGIDAPPVLPVRLPGPHTPELLRVLTLLTVAEV